MTDSAGAFALPVVPPYRLDLTAAVLRRLSTNIVDVFADGIYRRVLGSAAQPALLEVSQPLPDRLDVRCARGLAVLPLVRRMLGTDVDLTHFNEAAAGIPWLAALAARARGVKPPRYPSLWEAIVNAVVFQQVSIHAATAILRRLVERYEPLQTYGDVRLACFPSPSAVVEADPRELRALGLSANKIAALRSIGRTIESAQYDDAILTDLPTTELTLRLQSCKGIGPWSAAVIALRGFGRLDTFPLNDSGVARTLKDLSGDPDVDVTDILTKLGRQRGMLYYHLLLGRLAASGEIDFAPPAHPSPPCARDPI